MVYSKCIPESFIPLPDCLMPLKFHPDPGTILICDYSSGFVAPEMVKRRPAVVVSPRLRRRNQLCAVVPLSTTPPEPPMPYHHRLVLSVPFPKPWDSSEMWVKCDMLATVSFQRLELIRTGRDHEGKRQYLTRRISDADLNAVRTGIMAALGVVCTK